MVFWNERGDRPILVSGTRAFYINALLRGVVMSLVGIFTPIFVYRELGLIWVPIYYLTMRLTVLIGALPISRVIEKLGFRKSIAVSTLILASYLAILSISQDNIYLIMTAAIMLGIATPMYWVARHSAVSQDASKRGMGRTIGFLATMESIASLLSPFVGGVIITNFSYPVLYGLAAILLVVSLVPLWHMLPHTHHNGATAIGWWHYLTNRRYFHQAVGMMGLVGNDYSLILIWPLMLYLMGFSLQTVGGVFSIAAVTWVVLRLLTGSLFDKLRYGGGYRDETVFAVATMMVVGLIVTRLFLHNLNTIIAVEIITAAAGIVYSGFWNSYFHLGGKRMGSIAYYVYSEMTYSVLAILLMGIMILGIKVGIWRETVMLVSSTWVLMSVVIARESNM